MTNAIDRLEELERRAKECHCDDLDFHASGCPVPGYELALRNAAKPLLAVVRAGEKYRQAEEAADVSYSAWREKEHTDEGDSLRCAHAYDCEAIGQARQELFDALATLKETTL